MSIPVPQSNPTLDRLEAQINWYSTRNSMNQWCYEGLKMVPMVSAVMVPVLSVLSVGREYGGARGTVIVLAEGLQQFQTNSIIFRSTCESRRHEKHLYLAQSGSQESSGKPVVLLARRVEGLVSQEHSMCVSDQYESGKNTKFTGL